MKIYVNIVEQLYILHLQISYIKQSFSLFKNVHLLLFPLRIQVDETFIIYFSTQPTKRYINTMAQHPLIAVCQMRSIADKARNLQVVNELTAEARRKSAVVRIYIWHKKRYYCVVRYSTLLIFFLHYNMIKRRM